MDDLDDYYDDGRPDIVLEWHENDVGAGNSAYWVCTHNWWGVARPRVFGTESLCELLALLIEPPLYTPRLGDTLIIRPERDGAPETVKGNMEADQGDGRYTVQSFEDDRQYTGRRVDFQ
jgi:hypothetical protein